MPNIFRRVKDGLTGSSNPQHPQAQSANDQSTYSGASAGRAAPPAQQDEYTARKAQDDAQLQQALEESELEAALAASRLSSNSGAAHSGQPPRPAATEHTASDDEELKLALAMSEAEAKQSAKGKGVLRLSPSERELEVALQESAQLKQQHHHGSVPDSRGESSNSSHQQSYATEDADLARAIYESQQLSSPSSTQPVAAASSRAGQSTSSSYQQTPPSAPLLASPAAISNVQHQPAPATHQSPAPLSSSFPTPPSQQQHQAQHPPAPSSHRQIPAQTTGQSGSLYPAIYQPGASLPPPQAPSHIQYPSSGQVGHESPTRQGGLYHDGHHGSADLHSMLSADQAIAQALQDEEFAGAIRERTQQAPPPPSHPTASSSPSHLTPPQQHSSPQQGAARPPQSSAQQPSPQQPRPPISQRGAAPNAAPLAGKPNACANCGQSLRRFTFGTASFVSVNGRSFHPECFRCGACQQPIGANVSFGTGREDGLPYHIPCYREKFDPKCSVCHDFIPAQGQTIHFIPSVFWKQKVCPSHRNDGTLQCCSCNRWQPRGEQWVTQLDGRTVCLDCLTTIVRDTADAQPLYRQVLAFYQHLGMPLPEVPPLMLVETSALNAAESKEGRGSSHHGHGPVFHTRGLTLTAEYHAIQYVTTSRGKTYTQPANLSHRDRFEVTAILVLFGFPWLLTGTILAHECMHAWLRLRGVTQLPLQTEEGLCQLMGLLWLEAQDLSTQKGTWEERIASYFANQIRLDPSDVYGEGFRMALMAYQKHGLQTVLDQVQQTGYFPQ